MICLYSLIEYWDQRQGLNISLHYYRTRDYAIYNIILYNILLYYYTSPKIDTAYRVLISALTEDRDIIDQSGLLCIGIYFIEVKFGENQQLKPQNVKNLIFSFFFKYLYI